MNAQLRFAVAAGLLVFAAACAEQRPIVLRTPVGPSPTVTQDQPSSDGFLTVYTRTETYPFGEDVNDTLELGNWNWEIMTYSVHSDYAIYDPSGRLLKSVRNTASFHDPRPKVVALPAGNYSIQGLGDGNERWRVPVVIKAGRVTIVNLESNNRHIHGADDKDVVRGPDGRIIGWLAGPE